MPRRRREAVEDARRADDRRLLRRRQRHADHFEAEPRRVGIVDRPVLAAGQLLLRAHARRPGHIDIDVVLVVRIGDHRVRVRAAAGLHVGDVLRAGDVGDVEDADAAQPILADRLGHALDAAVDPPRQAFARHEQQVLVDRDVALRRRADIRHHRHRLGRVADVVDLEAVVVALDRVLPAERQIGVRHAEKLLARRRRRDQPHVPRRLRGVPAAGREADARIGTRRRAETIGVTGAGITAGGGVGGGGGLPRPRPPRPPAAAASAGGCAAAVCGRRGRGSGRRCGSVAGAGGGVVDGAGVAGAGRGCGRRGGRGAAGGADFCAQPTTRTPAATHARTKDLMNQLR